MHLRKTRHALLDSVAASHCRAGNVANKICKCTQVCVGRGPSGGCAQLMRTLHALPPSQGAHSVMASRQHWPSSSNILHCSSGLHRSMGTSARRGHWRTASRRQPPERRRRSSPLKLRSAPCAATPNSAPTHQHKADGQCSSASGLCHLHTIGLQKGLPLGSSSAEAASPPPAGVRRASGARCGAQRAPPFVFWATVVFTQAKKPPAAQLAL